jgi:hypothetical protein
VQLARGWQRYRDRFGNRGVADEQSADDGRIDKRIRNNQCDEQCICITPR